MRYFWLVPIFVLLAFVACEYNNDFELDSDLYGDAAASPTVFVAAGYFTMGSDFSPGFFDGVPDEPFTDEQPEHRTYVSAYRVEIHEVTNAQYRACVGAGRCEDPRSAGSIDRADYYSNRAFDDYPVTNVTWQMADDYCRWRERRLPSEAEWEKAARGTADERTFPWGWQEPTCGLSNLSIPRADSLSADAEYEETCHARPVEVGTYAAAASPFGLTEMAGNVSEWTADYYDADYYDAGLWPHNGVDPQGPPDGERRVIRGGNFASTAYFARVSFRENAPPETYTAALGFRCAQDVVP
ncbi:MAG: SUMF1/EgtB/PvdO family nonheme iron enzyme [Candidatus Lernaella stagnicola]|nr:SUMF1/EgtB/PvdO family nonheme iron enzyme [Candidatus Lernaella stagnicola]